jgi:hypothetical protein
MPKGIGDQVTSFVPMSGDVLNNLPAERRYISEFGSAEGRTRPLA